MYFFKVFSFSIKQDRQNDRFCLDLFKKINKNT